MLLLAYRCAFEFLFQLIIFVDLLGRQAFADFVKERFLGLVFLVANLELDFVIGQNLFVGKRIQRGTTG